MQYSRPWLPELLVLNHHNGQWERCLDAVYQVYVADFVLHRPCLDGLPVNRRRHPEVRGKEATFWHMVQEGPVEEERTPDLRRFERIRWPRVIIEEGRARGIKIWENKRGTQKCVCLWAEVEEYLVVLAKRAGYFLLVTAYPTTRDHTKRKLEKEYQAYIASAAP